jgi:hypothetical protein
MRTVASNFSLQRTAGSRCSPRPLSVLVGQTSDKAGSRDAIKAE